MNDTGTPDFTEPIKRLAEAAPAEPVRDVDGNVNVDSSQFIDAEAFKWAIVVGVAAFVALIVVGIAMWWFGL